MSQHYDAQLKITFIVNAFLATSAMFVILGFWGAAVTLMSLWLLFILATRN